MDAGENMARAQAGEEIFDDETVQLIADQDSKNKQDGSQPNVRFSADKHPEHERYRKTEHRFLFDIIRQNRHTIIEEPVLKIMIDEIKKNGIYMLKRIQHENIHSAALIFIYTGQVETTATAKAAAPSVRPSAPRRSFVVALTDILPECRCSTCAIFFCIFSVYAPIFGD